MMAEMESSLLNREVIMELDNEYFSTSGIEVTDLANDYVDAKQPIFVLES
jgi:hypothetical protein